MIVEDKYDIHYKVMDDFAQFEDDNFDGNMAKSREFEFAIMDHALEYLG